MITVTLFTAAKIWKWKQPKCQSMDEWIKTILCVCVCVCVCVILVSHEKEGNAPICNNMGGLEDIMLNAISRQTNSVCYHTCGI